MENKTKESVITISESTALSATDIDYIKKFIPPATGGRRRGVKQVWTKESKVQFAIVKRFMEYGIMIKEIEKIIKSIRELEEWTDLFDNGNLKADILKKNTHSYIYLYDADPGKIRIMLNKKKEIFGLGKDWHDVLIIDVTELLKLALPEK